MSFDIDQDCQFSFSNPFNRSITRTDFNLNFNPNPIKALGISKTNWDLYFFNQTGFNFYDKSFYGASNDQGIKMHWIYLDGKLVRESYDYLENNPNTILYDYGFVNPVTSVEPSRDWLSFGVVWKSNSNTEKENVLVAYVGEVTIKINDDIIKLPNSYSSVNKKEISIPKNSSVQVNYFYRYNAGINSFPNIPYASFAINDLNNQTINIFQSQNDEILENLNFIIFLIVIFNSLSNIKNKPVRKKCHLVMFLLYMIGFFLIPDSLAEYIEILTMGIVGYFIFFKIDIS